MAKEPKRAQQIAEQIEVEILNQRLPIGHRLGTEPELIDRYGVSRAVLREAIRIVERHQLAETRRGAGGGLFVAQPAEEVVANLLGVYLEAIGIGLDELFEARQLLEGELTRYAAIRGGKKGRRALEDILEGAPEPPTVSGAIEVLDRFYAELGELSRSPGLALFARAINLTGNSLATQLEFEKKDLRGGYQRTWQQLMMVAKAIGTRDAERAQAKIREVLADQERDWTTRKRRRRPVSPRVDVKRGDALGRVIRERIRARGLEPGDRLGSEAELVERYGVSRAVLREAIRLLELHGIVEMRRGLGGGLFVSEPDPNAVVRLASVYLAHLSLSLQPIKEVRMLLEPRGAMWVAERASDEAIAELNAELVSRLTLRGRAGAHAFRELHERIADLSGNRAVALFTRVMIAAAWGLEDDPAVALPEDALESIRHSDTRIVGAINERDPARTERLMRNHLELTLDWWSEAHSA